MKYLIVFIVFLGLFSCHKQDFTPNPPNPPVDIITDSTLVDSTLTLAGQKWVITKILLTDLSYENRTDTLYFIDNINYTFNDYPSTYDLDANSYNFKLTLNNTQWGHLIGTVYDYNISSGMISGSIFNDYMITSNTYKIWMHRI